MQKFFFLVITLVSLVSARADAKVCFLPGVLGDGTRQTGDCSSASFECSYTQTTPCADFMIQSSCEKDGTTYYSCTCKPGAKEGTFCISTNTSSPTCSGIYKTYTYACIIKGRELNDETLACGCPTERLRCNRNVYPYTADDCKENFSGSVPTTSCTDSTGTYYKKCACDSSQYYYKCDAIQLKGLENETYQSCTDSDKITSYQKCVCTSEWDSTPCNERTDGCKSQTDARSADGQTCYKCGPEVCENTALLNLQTYWNLAGITLQTDCKALGYKTTTPTKCGDGTDSLVCTFDRSYRFCPTLTCAIGDVYYADGTCSNVADYDDYKDSKTAVGVVYMLTDANGNIITSRDVSNHGRVISLRNLTINPSSTASGATPYFDAENPYKYASQTPGHTIAWGLYGIEVPNITAYKSTTKLIPALYKVADSIATSDLYDGQGNTLKIIATDLSACSNSNYRDYCYPTAAMATHLFYPPGVSSTHPKVGAGNWYLPAIGELGRLYGFSFASSSALTYSGDVFEKVYTTLQGLANKGVDARNFSAAAYLSSSPLNASTSNPHQQVFVWNMKTPKLNILNRNNAKEAYVRASLKF